MKNERNILIFGLLCLAVITALAFSISYNIVPIEAYEVYLNESYSKLDGIIAQIRYMIQNIDLLLTILTFLFFFLYIVVFLKYRKPWSKSRVVLASIYSFLSIVGKCFMDAGNLDFCFSGIGHFVLCLVFGISYCVFYYAVLTVIEWCLEKRTVIHGVNVDNESRLKKHSKLCTFIFVCICQLPNLYFFFPGIVNWDGLRQLDFWIGSLEWTTHHPAFSTIIMGMIFDIGKFLGGSDYFGFFLYVCIQIIVHAVLVTISMDMLREWGIDKWIRIGLCCFYSLFSIWQIYLITYIKDTSYYLAFWWFVICVIKLLGKKEIHFSNFVYLIISGFLVTMLRNDGICVVFPTIIIMLIILKKHRKEYIISIVVIMLGYIGINVFLVSAVGIGKGDIKEALSIPFQQTARYVVEYSGEVTGYEKQVIDKLILYDELTDRYNPDISDAVKGSKFDPYTKEDLAEYFKVWWAQFLKHPLCYIESFLNSSYRYWYIGAFQYERALCTYGQVTSTYVDRGDFEFEFIEQRNNGRKIVENLDNIEYKLPVINILYRPSAYIWILFFCVYFSIKSKNWDKLIICAPMIMCFLINMASPVNGSIRYALPIMVCMPLIFLYTPLIKLST